MDRLVRQATGDYFFRLLPSNSSLLMQGTQYPTSNLVMPQLYQMIAKLEMRTRDADGFRGSF
jgi:hypothetical protein